MKRIACIAIVGWSLMAAPLAAPGADMGKAAFVFSPGTESCGAWTQGRGAAGKGEKVALTRVGGARLARELWVAGFFSAVNAWYLPSDRGAVRNIAEGTDNAGLMAWIDNYCVAHPLDDLEAATASLATELTLKWYTAHPARK